MSMTCCFSSWQSQIFYIIILTVKIISLSSNVLVRVTEGLKQETQKRQSDNSTLCLIGVLGKSLSLPFLLAPQAGGPAFRYQCTQHSVSHFLANALWSAITNTVISSEHRDLHSADLSHAPQCNCFFGWRGETGNEATIIFLIEDRLGLRKFESNESCLSNIKECSNWC